MDAAEIGLGCVTFGREISEEESFRILDHACERGIGSLDTASAYGNGRSEQIIGNWMARNPSVVSEISIATKMAPPYSAPAIEEGVEKSLNRLQVPALDLFYLHNRDGSADSPEVLHALDRLVTGGRIRAIGVSNFDRELLSGILARQKGGGLTPFSALQNNFNYAVSDLNPDYRAYCHQQGIKVIGYSPLGAGFLTGKHRREVEPGSRFELIPGHQEVYFHDSAWNRLEHLEKIAAATGHAQEHLALAWALHQPGIHTDLVGGRKKEHIDQAIAAREFSDESMFARLNSVES